MAMEILISFLAKIFTLSYMIGLYYMFQDQSFDYMLVLTMISYIAGIVLTLTHNLKQRTEHEALDKKINDNINALNKLQLIADNLEQNRIRPALTSTALASVPRRSTRQVADSMDGNASNEYTSIRVNEEDPFVRYGSSDSLFGEDGKKPLVG